MPVFCDGRVLKPPSGGAIFSGGSDPDFGGVIGTVGFPGDDGCGACASTGVAASISAVKERVRSMIRMFPVTSGICPRLPPLARNWARRHAFAPVPWPGLIRPQTTALVSCPATRDFTHPQRRVLDDRDNPAKWITNHDKENNAPTERVPIALTHQPGSRSRFAEIAVFARDHFGLVEEISHRVVQQRGLLRSLRIDRTHRQGLAGLDPT